MSKNWTKDSRTFFKSAKNYSSESLFLKSVLVISNCALTHKFIIHLTFYLSQDLFYIIEEIQNYENILKKENENLWI
jgi:hypothetical protein